MGFGGVLAPPPSTWQGRVADAYAQWAAAERAAADGVAQALTEADRIVALWREQGGAGDDGGGVADLLAALDLPAAVEFDGPATDVARVHADLPDRVVTPAAAPRTGAAPPS
ncbi:hypothetical protein, partial [Tsukamurella soli]|uniref:hypothetical protein n=1 Tax=Tsukamurella soli TaxID=644556 RepID=UPI0031EDADE9